MSRSTSNSSTDRSRRRPTPTAPPEGWLAVGHLRRPHGLRGDIFLQLTTDRLDRVESGSVLFGGGRTFTVESHRRAGNGRIIAKLEGVDDRTAAEELVDVELFAEPIDDPDALWVHHLIGARVVDQHGTDHGECVAVVDNPAADLLELESGALVPSNFVTTLAEGVVHVEIPDGLFEAQGADGG